MRRGVLGYSLTCVLYCVIVCVAEASAASPYDDLLTASRGDASAPRGLSKNDAMRDTRILARILKEGYAGWEATEFDWNKAFVEIAAEIEAKTPLNAKAFVELLTRNLSGVEDRHFGFFLGEGRGRRWFPVTPDRNILFSDFVVTGSAGGDWKVVKTPKSSEDLVGATLSLVENEPPREYLFPTLPGASGNDRYLVGVASKSGMDRIELRFLSGAGETTDRKAPLHTSRARLKRLHPRSYRLTRIGFPRIELGNFSTLHSADLNHFVRSAESLRGENLVFLDLRGNSGGSDRFPRAWLESLAGGPFRSWKIRELISPVTLQGDVILHEWLLAHNGGGGGAREQAGGRLQYFRERLETARKEGLERSWIDRDEPRPTRTPEAREEPFKGYLMILVDRGTQSSAETFLLMARQIPGTLILGENTAGMMRFGEVKLYRLPHSGVWVQAGSKHFEDPTGAFQEGWGFAPDYWIDDSSLISSIPRLVEKLALGSGSASFSTSRAGSN